jgi:hypothetical protein
VRVYVPQPEEGFELCHPIIPADFENLVRLINGQPRADSWTPIPVEIIREDEGEPLKRAGSPWLGPHALILREDAAAAVSRPLARWGEFLPLRCSEAPLVVYNPTHVLDALDERKSDVRRFSNGRVMMVKRYVFREGAIGKESAFKIPNLRSSPTFFVDTAVQAWTAAGIRGVRFEEA